VTRVSWYLPSTDHDRIERAVEKYADVVAAYKGATV
jgi:hypothetical protein